MGGIKHKKAIVDARAAPIHEAGTGDLACRGEGGGDPEANAALTNAIQKAKDASMPKDNIERAIARAPAPAPTPTRSRRCCTRATGPAAWRC